MASADLESLAQALKQGRVAVLTGAGCSTESGIPDYRGSQGLWKRHPTELGTVYGMETWPEEFYAFYAARVRALKEARPNKAHRVLARFQKEGLLEALITQNVDGLHQAAGATDVIEVHGSMAHTRCQRCGRKDSPDRLLEPVTGRDDRPACRHCGGPMRPDIVLYGEQLPPEFCRALAPYSALTVHIWCEKVREARVILANQHSVFKCVAQDNAASGHLNQAQYFLFTSLAFLVLALHFVYSKSFIHPCVRPYKPVQVVITRNQSLVAVKLVKKV